MVSDKEIFAGIDLLASTEGVLTEPAGGTTVAVVKKLAEQGHLDPDETVVAMITGNGLKTLYEHPSKPWPSKVQCRHRDDARRAGGIPARGRVGAGQRAAARLERPWRAGGTRPASGCAQRAPPLPLPLLKKTHSRASPTARMPNARVAATIKAWDALTTST